MEPQTLTETTSPGILAIAEERARQAAGEGYTNQHDDTHFDGALLAAGICYADASLIAVQETDRTVVGCWPFEAGWWKPDANPLRNLEKAGALIAAEYDRIRKKREAGVRCCRRCGCTDDDCRACVERTGEPCEWVEEDLCSACAPRPITGGAQRG